MKAVELLDSRVATAFYGRFHTLREAQEAAIEPLISGKNVVLSSGTGSGKTEAVVAPLMSRYWRLAARSDALVLLYIAPTKALVNDLEKRLYQPLYSLGLRVGIRHGDRDDLAKGPTPHVLITTPESLDVMLFRKEPALSSLRAVVIDEVHLLYNTQRGLQLSILLQRLQRRLHDEFQWSALSATIGRLSDVRDFLMGTDEDAVFLKYPAHREIDAQVRHIPSEAAFLVLIHKLTEGRPTKLLVFANARRECERLAGVLHRDERLRHATFAHYSSLSPEVRVDTERKFAASNTAICIATSTLELGIDIGDIDAILLWGVPGGVESFLQRIGRGNRRVNKTNVVCLVPDTSGSVVGDALWFAALVDAARKGELPVRAPFELFGAVAQQCLSVVASDGGRFTRIAELCELMDYRAYLDREAVESVLAELAANGYLQRHGFKNQYGAEEALHQLVDYQMIYGNFGAGSQTVDVYHSSKHLGDVPAVNLLRIHAGDTVRFAGKSWRVQKASRDRLLLQPAKASHGTVDFTYASGVIHADAFVANRLWQLLHEPGFSADLFALPVRKGVAEMKEQLTKCCSHGQIPFSRGSDGIRYFTFAGYLVNKAIGLIANKPGFQADDLVLQVSSPIDWPTIPSNPAAYQSVFHLLFEPSSEQSIYQQQLPSALQLREFLQEWLRDETIPQILSRLVHSKPVKVEASTLGAVT